MGETVIHKTTKIITKENYFLKNTAKLQQRVKELEEKKKNYNEKLEQEEQKILDNNKQIIDLGIINKLRIIVVDLGSREPVNGYDVFNKWINGHYVFIKSLQYHARTILLFDEKVVISFNGRITKYIPNPDCLSIIENLFLECQEQRIIKQLTLLESDFAHLTEYYNEFYNNSLDEKLKEEFAL